MISMVWPFIVLTMSPGRWALPSGMFSTTPIAPTALTLALRAASVCIRPTTQAAPAMSPFMSSIPAAGLIEMPPVSKVTLADESNRGVVLLAAIPAHDDDAAVLPRSLPDAQQRVHAELLHRRHVEHFNRDAELLQHGRSAGELLREQHVGRLVDQVACHDHAIGDRPAVRVPGLLGRSRVADRERDLRLCWRFLALAALGLVAIEHIGAQLRAERDLRRLIRLERPAGKFCEDRDLFRPRWNFAHGSAAKLDQILRLELAGLADPQNRQSRHRQTGRRHNIEGTIALAGEPVGRRRPLHQVAGWRQRLPCRRPELQPLLAEQDKNTLGRRRKRRKYELAGVGHNRFLSKVGREVPLWRGPRSLQSPLRTIPQHLPNGLAQG